MISSGDFKSTRHSWIKHNSKIFLKMVHGALVLEEDLSFFNGETFLVHIPNKVLKDSVIFTNVRQVSLTEQVKSKIEALVTV